MPIAAGKITVIACASSAELQTADALLATLVASTTEAGAAVQGAGDLRTFGEPVVEGRDRGGELGNGARVAYFSGRELRLPLQAGECIDMHTIWRCVHLNCMVSVLYAGAVAGYVPGTSGSDLRRVLRAQVAAGAHSIIATLPNGPATFLKAAQHDQVDASDAELTEGLLCDE